jgi:hypothetical protein
MNGILWILPILAAPAPEAATGCDPVAIIRKAIDLTAGRSYAFISDGRFRMTGTFTPPDLLVTVVESHRSIRRGDKVVGLGPTGIWKLPGAPGEAAAGPATPKVLEIRRTLEAIDPPHEHLSTMLAAVERGIRDADRQVRGTPTTQYVLTFKRQPLVNADDAGQDRGLTSTAAARHALGRDPDRKSTRLNSSHTT